jgi:hypothetical protein
MQNNRWVSNPVILIFLLLFVAIYAFRFVNFSIAPYEDAAMLMRYAEHFAQGHGIVWNIGEKPVDGATDFLFMILVGLLVKAGLAVEHAVKLIGFVSHVLTVWIVYLSARKLFNTWLLPALVVALSFAVGPGLYFVAAHFGTPFFALFACISWYFALTTAMSGETRVRSLLFAVSALITGLIRPEGVILTGLMLLAIVHMSGFKGSRYTIASFIGVFLVFGGIYFLWRWNYFGFPLPNPFYKKGAGRLYLSGLRTSIENTFRFCLPFLPAFLVGFYSAKTRRMTFGFAIPIAGFALAFILLSDEANYGGRFQYALLPLTMMCWWPLMASAKEDLRFPSWKDLNVYKKTILVMLVAVLSIGVVGYGYKKGRFERYRDGRYETAVMLSDYRDRSFVVATTEAGLLPLYSRWKAVDTWGLNDQWIAHNKRITEAYLDRFKPHMIMFHEYFSPLVPVEGKGAWFEMVMTLKHYAEKNGYVLAAVFGESPYDTHYYYVRADFPESREIVNRIRSIEYYWYVTGRKAVNFVLERLCAKPS